MYPIQPEDFLHLNFPSAIALSPDGSLCCWLEHRPALDSNSYLCSLIYSPTGQMVPTVIPCSRTPSSPFWKDCLHICYLSVWEGHTELHSVNIESGEDVVSARIALTILRIIPVGRDRYLLLAEEQLRNSFDETATILEEIPFWADGKQYTDGLRTRLYLWENHKLTPLTPSDAEVSFLSCNGTQFLYSIRYTVNKKSKFTALCCCDLPNMSHTELIPPDQYDIFYAAFVGTHIMVCATDMKQYGNVQNPVFYLYDNQTLSPIAAPDLGVTNDVTTDARYGSCSQWAVSDKHLYCTKSLPRWLAQVNMSSTFSLI